MAFVSCWVLGHKLLCVLTHISESFLFSCGSCHRVCFVYFYYFGATPGNMQGYFWL